MRARHLACPPCYRPCSAPLARIVQRVSCRVCVLKNPGEPLVGLVCCARCGVCGYGSVSFLCSSVQLGLCTWLCVVFASCRGAGRKGLLVGTFFSQGSLVGTCVSAVFILVCRGLLAWCFEVTGLGLLLSLETCRLRIVPEDCAGCRRHHAVVMLPAPCPAIHNGECLTHNVAEGCLLAVHPKPHDEQPQRLTTYCGGVSRALMCAGNTYLLGLAMACWSLACKASMSIGCNGRRSRVLYEAT